MTEISYSDVYGGTALQECFPTWMNSLSSLILTSGSSDLSKSQKMIFQLWLNVWKLNMLSFQTSLICNKRCKSKVCDDNFRRRDDSLLLPVFWLSLQIVDVSVSQSSQSVIKPPSASQRLMIPLQTWIEDARMAKLLSCAIFCLETQNFQSSAQN